MKLFKSFLYVLGVLLAGVMVLFISLFFTQREVEAQNQQLASILNESGSGQATSKQILERIKGQGIAVAEVANDSEQVVIIGKPVVSLLGVGARWIVSLNIDEKDRVVASKLEDQPIGYL